MRAILINHCHPDTPHVCAVRAREFAAALARRGHWIVLLTETLDPDDPAESAADFADRLGAHDWAGPLGLACRPRGHAILRRQRDGRLPRLASRAVVAAYYAARASVFADWGAGVRPYFDTLCTRFAPEVVWANFGNTETLRIAGRLAAHSRCPWVLDVKDYWSAFIPRPFRYRLARLCRSATDVTTLSAGHADDIAPFIGRKGTVVYSGIPPTLAATSPSRPPDADRIVITGAIYDRQALDSLVAGIASAATGGMTIDYAGREGAMVRAAADGRPGIASVTDHGFIALDRLHALQKTAFVNAFVRSGPGWFQHKVPELLAAGRPILCIPEADAETADMARKAGVPLYNCATADDIAAALTAVRANPAVAPDREFIAGLTWDRRAETLEKVLLSAGR